MPSRFPNLLVNGSSGIAVGMATNIPPHNLGEVIDGVVCMIDNPECTVDDLMQCVKGPDFPTGGVILGRRGIYDTYHDRPRTHRRARQERDRGDAQQPSAHRRDGNPLHGQQGQAHREDRRAGARQDASRASPTSATSPTAGACASSSSSSATPTPASC